MKIQQMLNKNKNFRLYKLWCHLWDCEKYSEKQILMREIQFIRNTHMLLEFIIFFLNYLK